MMEELFMFGFMGVALYLLYKNMNPTPTVTTNSATAGAPTNASVVAGVDTSQISPTQVTQLQQVTSGQAAYMCGYAPPGYSGSCVPVPPTNPTPGANPTTGYNFGYDPTKVNPSVPHVQ